MVSSVAGAESGGMIGSPLEGPASAAAGVAGVAPLTGTPSRAATLELRRRLRRRLTTEPSPGVGVFGAVREDGGLGAGGSSGSGRDDEPAVRPDAANAASIPDNLELLDMIPATLGRR